MGLVNSLLSLDGFVLKIENIPSRVYFRVGRLEPAQPVLHVLEKGLRMHSHFVDLSKKEQNQLLGPQRH